MGGTPAAVMPWRSCTPRRLAVIGLGHVGCITAACLARLGHVVIGVDRDELKVDAVNAAMPPFYEPGLARLLADSKACARLRATTDLGGAVDESDIVMICVATPAENGNLGLEQLRHVCDELTVAVRRRTRRLVVVIRSTVVPGTCEQVVAPLLGHRDRIAIVDHPEFLREGSAVRDFLEPTLLVIGSQEQESARELADLYTPLEIEPCLVSLRAAEMIKYACNSFHALKVAFANEIGALCERMNIAPREVMDAFCLDRRLNISPAYLKPGFAFGGSCLPKDLRVLAHCGRGLDLDLPLLESVLPANTAHLHRAIATVADYPAHRVGIFGLAFKANTDDLRESPVTAVIEHLIAKGRDVRVFDPQVAQAFLDGTHQLLAQGAAPFVWRLVTTSLDELIDWCDCLVVAQTPSPAMSETLIRSDRPLVDLVGAYPNVRGEKGMRTTAASG
jgi:GDP-mannose 6-dehydrogenase